MPRLRIYSDLDADGSDRELLLDEAVEESIIDGWRSVHPTTLADGVWMPLRLDYIRPGLVIEGRLMGLDILEEDGDTIAIVSIDQEKWMRKE